MYKHQLNPSLQLKEEYKKSHINNFKFSEFETLNSDLGMTERDYSDFKKRLYDDEEESFIYYYNPDKIIETNTRKIINNSSTYEIGYFDYDRYNRKWLIAGMRIKDGIIVQGYFKKAESIFARTLAPKEWFEGLYEYLKNEGEDKLKIFSKGVRKYSEGHKYKGSLINYKRKGKGKYAYGSNYNVTFEFLNDKPHGPFVKYLSKISMEHCDKGKVLFDKY